MSFHGSGAVAFSTKGEYGVRLMVQLGRRYGTGPASLAEIAAVEDLPRAYLEQLVTSLRDAGLVVSTRGARGGYELARPPDQIRMSEVLRALEGPHRPDDLRHGRRRSTSPATASARCTVNLLWVRVRDAITGTLDGMTLADLVPARHIPLDPRLDAPAAPAAAEDARASRHAHRSHFVTDANDRELVIRDLRVAPAANPTSRSSRGSTSPSARARSTRSWAPTARARPPSATR